MTPPNTWAAGPFGADLSEAFTRQHYVAIAKVIKSARGKANAADDIAHALAMLFATDNPAFDRDRFLAACGA